MLASGSAKPERAGLEVVLRITLDVDEDVLLALDAIARQRGTSIGKVLSDLVRQALPHSQEPTMRNGVPLFPLQAGAGIVTPDLVNRLRDQAP